MIASAAAGVVLAIELAYAVGTLAMLLAAAVVWRLLGRG
jgi:hypothetical protein